MPIYFYKLGCRLKGEKEDIQDQFWEREYVSITKTSSITQTSKSSITGS